MHPNRAAVTKAVVASLPLLLLASVPASVAAGASRLASTASPAVASAAGTAPVFTAHVILSGATLSHKFVPAKGGAAKRAPLSNPDDITMLGKNIFVGFQNGVGPQGQPASDGDPDSTVVELNQNGDPLAQWDVKGKTDGVTADAKAGVVIATVNEDANSSLYTIDPTASAGSQVKHYRYSEALPSKGGTDAIEVYDGLILISASAPGTTGAAPPQPTYPAAYIVTLEATKLVAAIKPLFYDEATATVANTDSKSFGKSTTLKLVDPDSNEDVPSGSRFGGDFMLTSQGDREQIFVSGAGTPAQKLWVLSLSQSVDDTAWPTRAGGTLYSTDSTYDSVDTITGPFKTGKPIAAATPCGQNAAPPTCPAPPKWQPNYLASLNPGTGVVTALKIEGALYVPQGGLLFVP
ncbi:MAG TPA: hypothetical protein VGP46_07465 [Acidimicrobiales bacterium]|nr:hypothetical protein [Acidimicrobiales bacterium]